MFKPFEYQSFVGRISGEIEVQRLKQSFIRVLLTVMNRESNGNETRLAI